MERKARRRKDDPVVQIYCLRIRDEFRYTDLALVIYK